MIFSHFFCCGICCFDHSSDQSLLHFFSYFLQTNINTVCLCDIYTVHTLSTLSMMSFRMSIEKEIRSPLCQYEEMHKERGKYAKSNQCEYGFLHIFLIKVEKSYFLIKISMNFTTNIYIECIVFFWSLFIVIVCFKTIYSV